jgi:crossover junction endodeoxyribonuclease RusA
VRLIVYGIPIPQGSKTAFVVKGRAVVTDGKKGPALKEWRMAIAWEARKWLSETNTAPIDGPIKLAVTFYMPRPKSAPKRVLFPATRPDLDKLTRAVGDALAGIIYTEDSRIVDIVVSKRFAVNSAPRAEIAVEAVEFTALLLAAHPVEMTRDAF